MTIQSCTIPLMRITRQCANIALLTLFMRKREPPPRRCRTSWNLFPVQCTRTMIKIILVCATIIISVSIWRYYSPYQTFMRDCMYNEHYEWDLSKVYCTWHYKELLKEDSWLKEFLEN